jgi:hypothetical protein
MASDCQYATGADRSRPARAVPQRLPRGALLRERVEYAAPVGSPRPAIPEGWDQRPRRQRRRDRQPARTGTGPFDRSALPVHGLLEQSDGTAWMAKYCENTFELADQRPLRRQLELARADLVSDQLPARRDAARVPPLLPQRVHGRVPDRLGSRAEPGADRGRALGPIDRHLSRARERNPPGVRRLRATAARPGVARPDPLPRVLPP